MNPTVITYGALALAIACETVATASLKQSEQFTRLAPSLVTVFGYACAFYLLSVTLKTMPVGIAYAIWSGVGIILVSIIGVVAYKQHLDLAACIGLGLIVSGVLVINILSKTSGH